MDEKKFKVGDRVRRIGCDNGSRGAKVGQIATVIGFHGESGIVVTYDGHCGDSMDKAGEAWFISYIKHAPITEWEAALDAGEMYFTGGGTMYVMKRLSGNVFRCHKVPDNGSTLDWIRQGIEANMRNGTWKFVEAPKPIVIPPSPFYVRARGVGEEYTDEYKVEVDGLFFHMTHIESGKHYPRNAKTREIPSLFADGSWKLTYPHAPAVDPVVSATAEVQRLLRERADALTERDVAAGVYEKAEEKLRNIGKALREAASALDKANCDAAGVEYAG